MPSLKWSLVKSVSSYSSISKCLLCLQENLEIVNFEDQNHLSSNVLNSFLNVGMPTKIYYITTKQTINFSLK